MKKSSLKVTLSLACMLLFTLALQAQSYNLRYNLQKGKVYKYNNEFSGDITQQAMGQEMKMNNSGTVASKFVVDDIDKNGNMVLISSIDSGSVKMTSMMFNKTVSLESFANKRTKTYLNPSGKIIKSEIVDTMGSGLEAFGLSQNRLMQFIKLPENKVKAGENWNIADTDSIEMMGGKILTTTNLTFTLAGKENKLGHNCLKLTFTGDMKNSGKAKIQGMEVFIEGTGKLSGTAYFDASKGVLVSSEGLSNSDMTMATTGEQNMIIPITQSIKTSQTLVND